MALIHPNGKSLIAPTEAQVTVSHDQMIAVSGRLIDSQVGALLNMEVPPIRVTEMLTNMVTTILARFDPADARRSLTQEVVDAIKKDVTHKAGQRAIQQSTEGVRQ